MLNKKVFIFFAVLIFFFALFLRTYNLENIYVFTFDEEYQATYALTIVEDFHPIWIGVSASFLDYYVGPLFTYFTAAFLAFSEGDPILTAYVAAFTGAVTTVVIFLVGWRFFSPLTGITASTLYASLPLFVFYDQKFWNPMFGPLITILLFITIYFASKSKWWWVVFAGLAGLIFETELAPIPILFIGFWYFLKGKLWKDTKLIIVCISAFLLLYWPLIVFDLNHNFSNILVLTRLTYQLNEAKIDFNVERKFESFFDSLGRLWYLNPGNSNADEINISCNEFTIPNQLKFIKQFAERTYAASRLSGLSIMGIVIFLWFGFKNKGHIKMLAIFISVLIVSFFVYPGEAFEYHNLQLFSLLIFIPGFFLAKLNIKLKIGFSIIFLLVILLGINTVLRASDKFGLGPKRTLISKVMNKIGSESFALESRGVCHNWEGWRYLFKIYGRTPSQSYTDKNLGWLYDDEISSDNPTYTIILSEDRIPLTENFSKLQTIQEGGYRVYIKKN